MTDGEILAVLKIDLQISTTTLDSYLNQLITAAKDYITTEGITILPSDALLVEMYAAYLYRKRREDDTGMPRMLRYALNNRLLSEGGNG